jgi:hypothetical protein
MYKKKYAEVSVFQTSKTLERKKFNAAGFKNNNPKGSL